jgi:hypothetical protein
MALGIVLLQGPRGALFLMSEVPLFTLKSRLFVNGIEKPVADAGIFAWAGAPP